MQEVAFVEFQVSVLVPPLALKLESDRMANLVITDDALLPEREVILEERRKGSGSAVATPMLQDMNENASAAE